MNEGQIQLNCPTGARRWGNTCNAFPSAMITALNLRIKKLCHAKGYASVKHWWFRRKEALKIVSLVRDGLPQEQGFVSCMISRNMNISLQERNRAVWEENRIHWPSYMVMIWGWLRDDMISISRLMWTISCSSLILSLRMDFIATYKFRKSGIILGT